LFSSKILPGNGAAPSRTLDLINLTPYYESGGSSNEIEEVDFMDNNLDNNKNNNNNEINNEINY